MSRPRGCIMIYLPRRALFIHIPRTAGNSITNAIASICAGRGIDIILSTSYDIPKYDGLSRHAPAFTLSKFIDEWDSIYKFAIDRPLEERIQSTLRLIEKDKAIKTNLDPTCGARWKKILEMENYEDFIRKDWENHTTEWFTKRHNGEDLGVELYNYNELPDKWYEICDKCQIPRCELPHLNKV